METLTLPAERGGVNTDPVVIDGFNIGVIADLHIPYHDKSAIETALVHLKKDKIDALVLLGDVCDFYSISRHDKDPFENNFAIEARACRQFFEYMRSKFKKIPIYFKLGNHEERWEKYLLKQAPELAQLDTMAIAALLKTRDYGIRIVDKQNYLQAGKLNLVHGHEVMASGGKANPAYKLFQNLQDHGVCGHLHRTSSYRHKDITASFIYTYTVGCLCNLSPRYLPQNKNNWNHGFARVTVEGMEFEMHNKIILDGKVRYA